jgi:hypothetical protein
MIRLSCETDVQELLCHCLTLFEVPDMRVEHKVVMQDTPDAVAVEVGVFRVSLCTAKKRRSCGSATC